MTARPRSMTIVGSRRKGAVADDRVGAIHGHVEHRQAIDIDADLVKVMGDQPRIQIGGLARGFGVARIELAETRGGRTRLPVRRLQPRDTAAFLIDQDRRALDRPRFRAGFRPARAPDRALSMLRAKRMNPQGCASRKNARSSALSIVAGAAIDRTRAHFVPNLPASISPGSKPRLRPSAWSQSAAAASLSAKAPTRRRYQVPLSPRSTFCTSGE